MVDVSPEIEFVIHPQERILEVIYPERPTLEAFERYEAKVREAILGLRTPFDAIVDQRAPVLTSPELAERMIALSQWAAKHGLQKLVRIVADSPSAKLQFRRVTMEARLALPVVAVETREEAFAWLARKG